PRRGDGCGRRLPAPGPLQLGLDPRLPAMSGVTDAMRENGAVTREPRADDRGVGGEELPRLPAMTGPAVVESLPGLARGAASAARPAAGWGVGGPARGGLGGGRAVTAGDEAEALIGDVASGVGAVGDLARQVPDGTSVGTALERVGD